MSKHVVRGPVDGSNTRIEKASLSPLENLAVGSFSGALETCIQMPILTYKFCLQEGRSLPRSISSWYRGVFVQAGTVAPITAIQFMTNGILLNLIAKDKHHHKDVEIISAAAGAGAISAIVYSPVE